MGSISCWDAEEWKGHIILFSSSHVSSVFATELNSTNAIVGAVPDPVDRVFIDIDTNVVGGNTVEVTVQGIVEDIEEIANTANQKAVGAALDRFTGDPPELSDPGIDILFELTEFEVYSGKGIFDSLEWSSGAAKVSTACCVFGS